MFSKTSTISALFLGATQAKWWEGVYAGCKMAAPSDDSSSDSMPWNKWGSGYVNFFQGCGETDPVKICAKGWSLPKETLAVTFKI